MTKYIGDNVSVEIIDNGGLKNITFSGDFTEIAESEEGLSFIEAFDLPLLPEGRYPVNTGLARHPSGNGWLVGDDGRTPSQSSFHGGVIWYNDDFTQVLDRWFTVSDFGLNSNFSIQGIHADAGTNEFWCVARRIPNDTTNSKVLKVNATTGAVLFTALTQSPQYGAGNGIAVSGNKYYTLGVDGRISTWDMTGSLIPPIDTVNNHPQNDHLHNLNDGRLLLSCGANGSDGIIQIINESTMAVEKEVTVPDADAIEGIVMYDGFLWVNNDGHFHSGTPLKNRVLKYSVGDLLSV
ncbi:MAG: hypothetical protein CBC71_06295 [Rhodobacteraceae bacterium TMED111]|nr:hypothetical protein [Marinovum sp.]OUV41108.1 MAG: hypothetical protein CBC71_06295 [Rhodobacteraceae bacterium TMED111]|tara:strand:+ start:14474 stop:15355 length:882 start_codon:yes stop_codon:yes gene_type:complete